MASADSTAIGSLLTMGESCRLINCHANSLRAWEKQGKIPAYRIGHTGQRKFLRRDLLELAGIENTEEKVSDIGAIFGYARVSSTGQAKGLNKGEENSLTRQIDEIQEHIRLNYSIEKPPIYSDVASSLNFSRPGLTKMIRAILGGKHDNGTMIITFKDRLCRIGAEIIFLLAEIHNIKVLILNKNERQSSVIEMAEDVSAFVSLMANRMMATRGAKVLKKHITDETRARIHELRSEGLSIAEVFRVIFSEGHKATNSRGETVIGPDVIRKTLNEKLQLATNETTVERYYRDCIEPANEDCRIEKKLLFQSYANWSKARGSKPASMNMVGRILKNLQVKESNVHVGANVATAWAGIRIKNNNLHVVVSTRGNYKPQKRSIEKQNHFIEFAQTLVNEQWQATRGELNARYLAHCEQNSIKPIKLRLIPEILAKEFSIQAKLTGKSHIYSFGENLQNPPILTSSCVMNSCELEACSRISRRKRGGRQLKPTWQSWTI